MCEMNDPAAVYAAQLSARQRDAAAFESTNARFAYARLAIAIAAAAVVWLALSSGYSILWVLIPVCAFVALMMAHERVQRRVQRLRRAQTFFERGVARLKGEWEGHGETGEGYLDPAHPYFRISISSARRRFSSCSRRRVRTSGSHAGEMAVDAGGSGGSASASSRGGGTTHATRSARTTRGISEDARTGVDPVSLARWGEAEPQLAGRGLRISVWAFRILGIAGLAAGFVGMIATAGFVKMAPSAVVFGRDLFLLALAVNGIFYYRNRAAMERVVAAVDEAAHELRLVADVLALLEKQSFRAPMLASCARRSIPKARRLPCVSPG